MDAKFEDRTAQISRLPQEEMPQPLTVWPTEAERLRLGATRTKPFFVDIRAELPSRIRAVLECS
jgi:hypothetical protein